MALALLLEQRKASLPVGNAGHLLLGFLKYYSRVFDLEVLPGCPLVLPACQLVLPGCPLVLLC